jgi:hypothetical protein
MIVLRFVAEIAGYDFFEIGHNATSLPFGKLSAHISIETSSTSAEKRLVVHNAIIHQYGFGMIQYFHSIVNVHGDIQMACKTVT